jgi:hypothetical protein
MSLTDGRRGEEVVPRRRPRTAQAGDLYVVLEPAPDEVPGVRRQQLALRSIFGGRPHDPVHFSCQRFELPTGVGAEELIRRLREGLRPMPAFPIVAKGLVQLEHSFWGTRLLRWRVRPSKALTVFLNALEDALRPLDAVLHFPTDQGWRPSLVTALEDVGELDLDAYPERAPFPHYLFTARRAVLSRILGPGRFEVLASFTLRCPGSQGVATLPGARQQR